jgi:HAD superfamily hydrolase (TIGR01490 family)
MAEEKIIIAIFDFDGTLTGGHLWSGIYKHHSQNKIKRLPLFVYLITHLPFWIATKMGVYSEEKNRSKWGEDLSVLFKGFTTDQAHKAFEWVAENYFKSLMHQDVVTKLEEHKMQGYKIMLLSGMFKDFLEVMAEKMRADYVVGTNLEVVNNIYSGHIIPPLCFGDNKARLLAEFVRKQNIDVDYSRSYAYADSIYDMPVLRMVGNPIATYPDKELSEFANSAHWQIINRAISSSNNSK